VDEALVLDVEDRDHGTRRFGDDASDEVEGVLGALPDDHDGGVGTNGRSHGGDVAEGVRYSVVQKVAGGPARIARQTDHRRRQVLGP